MSLPLYFAINQGYTFKLYQNTLYKKWNTVNVVWPVKNIRPIIHVTQLRNEVQETSLIRRWNSLDEEECKWAFNGQCIKVFLENFKIEILAPVIAMTLGDMEKLPYNSCAFSATNRIYLEMQDHSRYSPARVYYTDPNSVENTIPVAKPLAVASPVASPKPLAVASPKPVAMASPKPKPMALPIAPVAPKPMALPIAPVAMASPMPKPIAPLIPPHIVKIVLADAIRKNDVCPITSEEITEANATVTPCGHVFCKDALKMWLSQKSSKGLCPICKQGL
jgi:hypothetical protein